MNGIGGPLLVLAAALAAASAVAAVLTPSTPLRAAGPATATQPGPGLGPVPIDTWLIRAAVGGLWIATVVLGIALITEDTTYLYVVEQTRPDMPLPLRVSSLWAGAAGSLLFFAAIASSTLLTGHRNGPVWQRVGVGAVVAGLAVTSLQGADPFERVDLAPLGGIGMAPILEHYAMVIHPPLLYLGMCGAMVPALLRDRATATAHRAGAVALAVLTVALALGSAWAYVELGWGGWWAWDPIENVALIVWLMLAAALHWAPRDRAAEAAGRPVGPGATVVWALCWPAVIGGAALTRTSLRTSVHAFADASTLGGWLWPLVTLTGIGAALRIWEVVPADRRHLPTPSRTDVVRRLPQGIVLVVGVIIAAGTYRPFIGGDGTAGYFYSRSLFPFAVGGAALLGVLPLLGHVARSPMAGAKHAIRTVLRWGLPVALVLTAMVAAGGWRSWFQLLLTAAVGVGIGTLAGAERAGSSTGSGSALPITARFLAHLGLLAILFAAVAGTASTESVIRLQPGESGTLDGHRITVVDTAVLSEDPLRAEATVVIDDRHTLRPSVAVFPERGLRLPEVSTRTRPWLDIQVVLRDVQATEGALLTVLFRPWNQLVWWGSGLLTLAALLLVFDRRRSAPETRPSRAAEGGPARFTPPSGTVATEQRPGR